jgi:SAM-dependent methyltransferase
MADDGIAMKADHYDAFAVSYARETETGLFNAHYARPAIIDLAGDVAGRNILDAGCGAGPLAAALRERGAQITGFDSSPAMVALAERRLGTDTKVLVADLAEPLPFSAGEFDDVVASLVLHYLEDWSGPLAELHRVLKPGGRLIISVNHPVIRPVVYPDEDYFAISPYTEDYTFDGDTVYLTFWHRPLHAMTDAFTRAGFKISVISEPPFSPDTPRELLPPDLGDRTAFLCFLFFVLEAV